MRNKNLKNRPKLIYKIASCIREIKKKNKTKKKQTKKKKQGRTRDPA